MLSFIQCSGCNSRITYIVVFQNRCSMFGNLKGLFRSQSYAGISSRPFSEKPVIKNTSWLSEGWNGMLESVEEDLLWNRAVAREGWPVRNTGWSTSSQHKVMTPVHCNQLSPIGMRSSQETFPYITVLTWNVG